jgi:hypothetical protein
MRKTTTRVTHGSPQHQRAKNDYLAAQAPHLALQAPHFCIVLLAPHLLPVQARHIMEQPPSAAVVTTAMASALERVKESEFIKVLLLTVGEMIVDYLAAAQPLVAPLLALQAPHLDFIFLALALCALLAAHFGMAAPHLALQAPPLAMLVLVPHLVPAQAAAKAPPERAAAVTTAEAMVLAILDERLFIKNSLDGLNGQQWGNYSEGQAKRDFRGHSRLTLKITYTGIQKFIQGGPSQAPAATIQREIFLAACNKSGPCRD